jgi:CRP-like cAMP-binding protein
MIDEWVKSLAICPLFDNIATNELDSLIECFSPRSVSYRKGEYVCLEGDRQEEVGILLNGRLSICRETISGNKTVLTVLDSGDMFGEIAAFSGRQAWPASVLALENSDVVFIPIRNFSVSCAKSCESHSHFIRNMLGIISRKAIVLNRKVEYLTIKGMREKISRYILEQYRLKGNATFVMDMNRSELADFLNVSRPSMSRELGRMRDEGLIEFYRASVRILKLDELEKFSYEAS